MSPCCDKIGHATFSDATFADATFSDATFSELRRFHTKRFSRFLFSFILRKVIRMARRGVGLREWGKSIAIQFSDVFKEALLHLGVLLHREGRIPDRDLLFFFSYEELHRLVFGGNAKLVAK